jgi:hypothetical protein
VAQGAAELNGMALEVGDGEALRGEAQVTLSAREFAELLLFDLPE